MPFLFADSLKSGQQQTRSEPFRGMRTWNRTQPLGTIGAHLGTKSLPDPITCHLLLEIMLERISREMCISRKGSRSGEGTGERNVFLENNRPFDRYVSIYVICILFYR